MNSIACPAAEGVDGRALHLPHMDRRAWGVCAFLVLVTALIYAQVLRHPFLLFDDDVFVSSNPHVSGGLTIDAIWYALTDGPAGEWYPLAMLSHIFDCELFGLNAWGHHLTSVLLHAAASIALFLVLRQMTGEIWPSAFVATLFAVHPQHVESVAWVAERRDVLSGLFFMLTLGAYLGYVRHGRHLGRYVLVASLFALGLMAKQMLVTLPPLLLLLDFWPLARMGGAVDAPRWTQKAQRPGGLRLVLEKMPLVAIAAAACVMAILTHAPGAAPRAWPVRLGNAAVACVTYVVQFFYPVDLALFYPYPVGGPPAWKVAGAIAILAIISAAAVIWRRRCPYFFVGWFWYLGMLAPVAGLVQVADHAMADRYMYLPGIGLSIALAWGGARLAERLPRGGLVLAAGAGLATVVLVGLAARQTSLWRDDEVLWSHALACTTDNGKAEYWIGEMLVNSGRLDDAIPHFQRAHEFLPSASCSYNVGLALARAGRVDEAIVQFRRSVALAPRWPNGYALLGAMLARKEEFAEATECFRTAVELDPFHLSAHNQLARLLLLQGDRAAAAAEIQAAMKINPDDPTARQNFELLQSQSR
jgi:Flp pilus assembly protein TadD